jgi:hypothetical protein
VLVSLPPGANTDVALSLNPAIPSVSCFQKSEKEHFPVASQFLAECRVERRRECRISASIDHERQQ